MRTKSNIFFGEGIRHELALKAYRMLLTREWVTYADVLKRYLDTDELKMSVSKYDEYGELKKAFRDVYNAIDAKYPKAIAESGNNRSKRFRYTGEDDDPLADLVNTKVINDIREYVRFCQDSAGFFPISWLEYFFKDCRDLLQIEERRRKGDELLTSSIDRNLTNIELLPKLYECIKNKTVIEFDYKPFFEEVMHLTFHPQHLREYNGRWHLMGHAKGEEPEWSFNVAIDRIEGRIYERREQKYESAPQGFYSKHFADIVGLTHMAGETARCIRIRAHSLNIFKLMETKCLHRSQKTVVPYGKHDDGEYGEFEVRVELNNEFIGSVLQLGPGLEVTAPEEVRRVFAERVREMNELYGARQNGTCVFLK